MDNKKIEKRIYELEQKIANDDRACDRSFYFWFGLNIGLAIACIAVAIVIVL